jgi:hypothetical protein
MQTRCLRFAAAALLPGLMSACALSAQSTVARGAAAPSMSELWTEPEAARDLFWGPGGSQSAPDPNGEYRFVALDTTGRSRGYDVVDAQGHKWSVKIGEEAQSEVVVSRLLWAAGYFQPANYYLPAWKLTGAPEIEATQALQPAARFRLDPASEDRIDRWSWSANPFVGTPPLRGLFVLMVMVNNWDLKTQQNPLYEVTEGGAPAVRRYLVRDLGASLGRTRWFRPGTKSNLVDFENERFIRSVDEGEVEFYYRGGWREPHLKRGVSTADVNWIAERLARLTPAQWNDAFRAGGYSQADSDRFVRRLQQKVEDGLRLRP